MTNKRKITHILCLTLFISACTINQPPSSKEMLVDSLPESTQIPNEWGGSVNNGKVDNGWLKNFSDARLETLVNEVLANNQNLQAAAAKVNAAAELAKQAGAALLPTIGFSGESSTKDVGGLASNLKSSSAFLSASWELDIWGRVRAGVAASDAINHATKTDYEYARQSLVALMAKTWFLATQINIQQKLSLEAVDIFSQLVGLVDARQQIGLAAPQDLSLAKARQANAEANLRQAQSSYRKIVRSLEVLLGRYPSAELEVNSDYIAQLRPIPTGLPSEILERRPDLIAAEKRVASAFFNTQQAKAARLPRIKLTASAGAVDNGLMDILNTTNPIVSLGANLFAPLYTGGALKAAVAEANAKQRAAMSAYAQTVLDAFQEVETALNNEQLFRERETFLSDVVSNNKEAYRVTLAQYEVGRIDLLTVLQTQASLLSARSSLVAATNERLSQRVNLHLALGGDFESAPALPSKN